MNAKIKLTLAAAMTGLLLASCGGKSISRADAEAQLEVISKGTPAAQTKVTYENGSDKVVASKDDNYIHYVGAVADKNDSTKKTNYDIYAWIADGSVNLRYSNGSDKLYYSSSNADLQSTISSGVATRVDAFVSGSQGQAAYLKSFMEKVDAAEKGSKTSVTRPDGSQVETGATTPGNAYVYFGAETYKSSGDGNLVMDFELMYPAQRNDAEKEHYVWENYLLKEISVDIESSKRHTKTTWNYGKADIEKPGTDGYTAMNSAQLLIVSAVLVANVFATK